MWLTNGQVKLLEEKVSLVLQFVRASFNFLVACSNFLVSVTPIYILSLFFACFSRAYSRNAGSYFQSNEFLTSKPISIHKHYRNSIDLFLYSNITIRVCSDFDKEIHMCNLQSEVME